MKRNKALSFIILMSFVFIFYIIKCSDPIKTELIRSSFSIEESKRRGVFICEYTPTKKGFSLGHEYIRIEEIWVEKMWYYKNQNKDVEILDEIQGYVKLNVHDDLYNKIRFTYSNGKRNGVLGNKLTFDLKSTSDTINTIFRHGEKDISILFLLASPRRK